MGWKFYGYAAAFWTPDDKEHDVLEAGCFADFLLEPDHLTIPMYAGHPVDGVATLIGRWLRMEEDTFGLKVWGELLFQNTPIEGENIGLSIGARNPIQVPPYKNQWGGHIVRRAALAEISIVPEPSHPDTRILGEWTVLPLDGG